MRRDQGERQLSQLDAKKIIEPSLRANVVFRALQRRFNVHVPTASRSNIENLQERILPLSAGEQLVLALVQKHLVYSHATPEMELIEEQGELSSLKVRQFEHQFTGNRNTAINSATDGNVFATAELGDTPAPPHFLGNGIDFLRIHPETYKREQAFSALEFAWISTHLSEYYSQSMHTAEFGNTVYQIRHYKDHRKTYTYFYNDGTSDTKTVSFSEEIFMGKEIPTAIALKLIEHLRLLKNDYPQSLFDRLADETIEEEDKVKLLYEVMQYTWPSSMYPEVKIPGKLDISKGVTIQQKKVQHEIASMTRYLERFTANPWAQRHTETQATPKEQAMLHIKDGNIRALEAMENIRDIIAEIDRTDVSTVKTAIIYLSTNHELIPMLECLLRLGASIQNNEHHLSPMYKAIEKANDRLLEFLIAIRIPSPIDPHLKMPLQINHAHPTTFDNAVTQACECGNLNALNILQRAGTAMDRFPAFWIHTAAEKGHLDVVLFFERLGFDFTQSFTEDESPLLSFAQRNDIEGVTHMLALGCQVNAKYIYKDKHFEWSALHFAAEHNNEPMAVLLLEQKEIDVDACSAALETPLSIAHHLGHDTIKDLLLKHGADETLILPSRPDYKSYQHLAIAIVTGIDNKEQPVVVLGRKWSRESGMLKRLQFPGGIKENSDQDFTAAAAREFAEETNFPLDQLLEQGEVKSRKLYTYQKGIDSEMRKIVFVHFELGTQFASLAEQYPFKAQDDLAQVSVVPLSQVKTNPEQTRLLERHTILLDNNDESLPILPSNGLLLEMLSEPSANLSEILEWECDLEHFPSALAKQAVRENNIPLLERLAAEQVSFLIQCYSGIETYSLFGYACSVANPDTIRYLSEHFTGNYDAGMCHPVELAIRDNPQAEEILGLLIELNILSENGCIKGLYAALKAKKETLAITCIEHSPKIANTTPPTKQPPLTEAVKYGCNRVIPALLAHGAEVNSASKGFGVKLKPPLFQAIESGNAEGFSILLQEGADINCPVTTNDEDQSTLQLQNEMSFMLGMFTLDPNEMAQRIPRFGRPEKQCPLSVAITHGQVEMATTLYRHDDIDLALAAECLKQSNYLCVPSPELRQMVSEILERSTDEAESAQGRLG